MMKTCSVCGRIHDINKTCYRHKKKPKTTANKFRDTYEWKEKRNQIRARDKHLCQICLEGKYDTFYRYNYNQLEVHHIIPIEEDCDKKLDSENLITLCNMHHKMAEDNKISREELQEIVARKYNCIFNIYNKCINNIHYCI
jgi:5-methylcytosine-specific restriction endonuclease McrA